MAFMKMWSWYQKTYGEIVDNVEQMGDPLQVYFDDSNLIIVIDENISIGQIQFSYAISQVPPFVQNKRFEGNKLFLNSHSSERGFSILEFAKDSIHTKSDTIKILYDKKNKLKLSYTLANSKKVTIQKGTTEIDINQIPNKLSFDPAFNPFNPLTTFSFNLPEAMNSNVILLQIYDIKGRSVETLLSVLCHQAA